MNLNLREWMKSIDDNVNLLSLSIPATHDSVTQYVQLSHFAKCQDRNIYEQLNIGIRALDLRVKSEGDRLKMVHGIAKVFNNPSHISSQMDMADVLNHCYNFLAMHPSEAIIIQFKNDNNRENEHCFDNLFNTYISPNKDKWYTESKIPTLKQARGKIVLIRRCKIDEGNPNYNEHNTGIDFSSWVEQDEITPEPLELQTKWGEKSTFIIQDRFKYKPAPRWSECIKPFLDSREGFNERYIICFLSTAGGLLGPQKNAEIINKKFLDYPLNESNYYGIIYFDFPNAELTKKVIKLNFKDVVQ